MKKILILAAMLLSMCSSVGYAQKKADNNYNLQKAYEVLKEEKDEDKAIELLGKQLDDTPENVEALLLRAKLFRHKEEYGNALSDINQALKCNTKKSGIYTSTLHWWKASVYKDMRELDKALESYKTALDFARKDNKKNIQDISFEYAQVLYLLERFDESDVVYMQMLKEDETDQAAMVGLARNMVERKDYSAALDMLGNCLKLDSDYSEIYRFQMAAYDGLGETDKAIDAGIKYFDKDEDANTSAILEVMSKHSNYAVAKVKAEINKKEREGAWTAFLCKLYEDNKEYESAIKQYDILEDLYGKSTWISLNRASCYRELGLFDRAIDDASYAVGKESDAYTYASRADLYRSAGRYNEAIADYNFALESESTSAYLYYARGWSYELSGDSAKAMADYELGIDLDQSYPYIYLMRGTMRLKKGEMEKAREDFDMVVAKDTVAESGSCTHYALHFLGRDDEAVEWMEKIIESDPKDAGHYYDKACLYARIGDLQKSMEALKTSLEMGYCSFVHMENDDDMNPIRNLPEYIKLVNEYKGKLQSRIRSLGLDEKETGTNIISEIEMHRHQGGTFEIPCQINNLPLNMIFDTGASDVTISSVEANFMLKNGYLSPNDFKGKTQYLTASGDIHEGVIITLKEIKLGDAVLKNIDASVVKNQKAPLLFGQSAMEKFGIITIDNINSKLIIKQ